MSGKKKLTAAKRQVARKRQWQKEDESLREYQRNAARIKKILRERGITAPFYDYLDSYPEEFQRISNYAKSMYPSLLGVHEVEEAVFDDLENHWADFGYDDLRQISYTIEDDVSDYGAKKLDANLRACLQIA